MGRQLRDFGPGEVPWKREGRERLKVLQRPRSLSYHPIRENFGLAVLEAIAAGLPVVISDRVNIHQEISDAKLGWVTKCDAGEIATALYQPSRTKTTNAQFRANTGAFLEDHYSPLTNAKRLEREIANVNLQISNSARESPNRSFYLKRESNS